jgi:hypothetical protein
MIPKLAIVRELIAREAAQPIVFKVLVNDLSWNTGAEYSVAPGASVALSPTL